MTLPPWRSIPPPVLARDDYSCGAQDPPRNRSTLRSSSLIGRSRADDRGRTVVFLRAGGLRAIKRYRLSHNLLFRSSPHFRSGYLLSGGQTLRPPCRIFSTLYLLSFSAAPAVPFSAKFPASNSLALPAKSSWSRFGSGALIVPVPALTPGIAARFSRPIPFTGRPSIFR